MGNFADDLRKTPPPDREPTKVELFLKEYDQKRDRLFSSLLHGFKGACSSAAAKGKRSVLWNPGRESSTGHYSYGIFIGDIFCVEMRFHAKKMANEIKQMLDCEISKMGFSRYRVRIEDQAPTARYGLSNHYYSFVFEARW